MSGITSWQARPVFITSTFRDMQEERDWLRDRVFPELAERLRERFHHLEPVDLRWGVSADDGKAEEQAREVMILKVCLEEIRRSRPFLIGLIGDRYGCRPAAERMQAAAREAGLRLNVAGCSVTELEILHGVLADPGHRQRSWFYFRKPLPYDRMPADVAAQYSDEHDPDPGAVEAAARLERLKKRIGSAMGQRVRTYEVEWDEAHQKVTGLDAWGRQVTKDLWSDLEAETAEYLEDLPRTWQEEDRRALQGFIEDRNRTFVGRGAVVEELVEMVSSPGDESPYGMCVTGAPGAGKSSLFGRLYRRLQDAEGVVVLAHAAGISAGSTRLDRMLRRWVEELAAISDEEDPLPDDASIEEVEEVFGGLLGRASTGQRVVVLVDALDQFERTPRARQMTWLPKSWPPNVRWIATATPGSESEAILRRSDLTVRPLPRLDEAEVRRIVVNICGKYHRRPSPQMVEALLERRGAEGEMAAANPLWLELAVEELNLLSAGDFEQAERRFPDLPGAERSLALLLATVEELPAGVGRMYDRMLTRARELFGRSWTDAFVRLLAASRAGWRRLDLRVLMPVLSGEPWDDLRFASLRRTFRAHVVQRGTGEQWDFAHLQMRQAAKTGYAREGLDVSAVHTAIAEHLRELPREDPVRTSETMFHLIGAGDRPRAAWYYAMPLEGVEESSATDTLVAHIRDASGTDAARVLEWVASLLDQEDLPRKMFPSLCHRLLFRVAKRLGSEGNLDAQLGLLRAVEERLVKPASRDRRSCWILVTRPDLDLPSVADAAERRRELRARKRAGERERLRAVVGDEIGKALKAQGRSAEALQAYLDAQAVLEGLIEQDPRASMPRDDLAVNQERIADLRLELGEEDAAREAYERSLELRRQVAAEWAHDPDWQLSLAIGERNMGNFRKDRAGDPDGALEAYRRAETILERLLERHPKNAEFEGHLAGTRFGVGDALAMKPELGGAERSYRAALAALEEVTRRKPDHLGWRRDLGLAHLKLGVVRERQKDAAGALDGYVEAGNIFRDLMRTTPDSTQWQDDYAYASRFAGALLANLGEIEIARQALGEARDILERLTALDRRRAGWREALDEVTHNLEVLDSLAAKRPAVRTAGSPSRLIPSILIALGLFDLTFVAVTLADWVAHGTDDLSPLSAGFGLLVWSGLGVTCLWLGLRQLR